MSHFNEDPQSVLSQLDNWTKQGYKSLVLKELIRIVKAHPDPEYLPQLARIANRNHAYVLAFRILHSVISLDREGRGNASPDALITYATSLLWIGALEEAQSCLKRVKNSTEALLTQAFIYFAQWDYKKSIPILVKYVNASQISTYQKLVGEINLLAAYISTGNFNQARTLVEILSEKLSADPNYKILYGNCLELQAQIEIHEGAFDRALVFLQEAEEILKELPGRSLLYVKKWKAIVGLSLHPAVQDSHDAIAIVKKEALLLRNWETLRDCDFHAARLTSDKNLLDRVLLGTPYQGYHDRIKLVFGISAPPLHDLTYCPGEISRPPLKIGLDLEDIYGKTFLNPTSWSLLQLLTKDIYRPPRMGVVFSTLYPDEYFNPYTSPQRVRNSVFRFNEWAELQTIDFRIKINQGDFFLVSSEKQAIKCISRHRPLQSWQATLNAFKLQNESRSFTSLNVSEFLGISQRNALNIIKKGLAKRKLQKIGQGKNCRYIFFSGRRAA